MTKRTQLGDEHFPIERVVERLRLHLPPEFHDRQGELFLEYCRNGVEYLRGNLLELSPKEHRDSVERVRAAAAGFRTSIEALPAGMRRLFGGTDAQRRLETAPKFAASIERDATRLAQRIRVGKGVKAADGNTYGVARHLLLSHRAAFGCDAKLTKTGWFPAVAEDCGKLIGVKIGLDRLKEAVKHLDKPDG